MPAAQVLEGWCGAWLLVTFSDGSETSRDWHAARTLEVQLVHVFDCGVLLVRHAADQLAVINTARVSDLRFLREGRMPQDAGQHASLMELLDSFKGAEISVRLGGSEPRKLTGPLFEVQAEQWSPNEPAVLLLGSARAMHLLRWEWVALVLEPRTVMTEKGDASASAGPDEGGGDDDGAAGSGVPVRPHAPPSLSEKKSVPVTSAQ